MTPGSPGLMGALLIVIGLALALLAIAIVLNRRDGAAESREIEAESPDEVEQPAEREAEPAEEGELVEATAESQPVEDRPGVGDVRTNGESERMVPAEPETLGLQEAADIREAALPPSPRELLPVAELLREEVTGELILRLGDQYLRSPDEIESDAVRRKLQYASADLAAWFEGGELPARRDKRQEAATQPATTQAEPEGAESGAPPGREAEGPRPMNMIDAINTILEKKLAAAEDVPRAVRLVPDPTGGVRVLIGVKSYPLEEVPDEGIKHLIRQAVGEWEASQ